MEENWLSSPPTHLLGFLKLRFLDTCTPSIKSSTESLFKILQARRDGDEVHVNRTDRGCCPSSCPSGCTQCRARTYSAGCNWRGFPTPFRRPDLEVRAQGHP
jgi:hypothetical protein